MSNEVYNLLEYVKPIPKVGQQLIKKYFPGALTIVTEKSDRTPDYITSNMSTVGIRVPDNEVFREICEIIPNHVLATTSANISGKPDGVKIDDFVREFDGKVDIIVDGGTTELQHVSTIVQVDSNGDINVIREGTITIE
jgi:L-threonylcarbamoyladenylate synthase